MNDYVVCEQKEQAGHTERAESKKKKSEEELENSKEDVERLRIRNQKVSSDHQVSEIGFSPLGK
jgi:hypothetical protein